MCVCVVWPLLLELTRGQVYVGVGYGAPRDPLHDRVLHQRSSFPPRALYHASCMMRSSVPRALHAGKHCHAANKPLTHHNSYTILLHPLTGPAPWHRAVPPLSTRGLSGSKWDILQPAAARLLCQVGGSCAATLCVRGQGQQVSIGFRGHLSLQFLSILSMHAAPGTASCASPLYSLHAVCFCLEGYTFPGPVARGADCLVHAAVLYVLLASVTFSQLQGSSCTRPKPQGPQQL